MVESNPPGVLIGMRSRPLEKLYMNLLLITVHLSKVNNVQIDLLLNSINFFIKIFRGTRAKLNSATFIWGHW